VSAALKQKKQLSTRIGIFSIILGICWTCAVITSYAWNLHLQNEETREIASNVARAYIQSDNSYRRWNALHGGVYLESQEKHSSKIPTDVPEQEVFTLSGQRLVLTDHATMMDAVYGYANFDLISMVKLKSLDPLSK
jgi:hypothetical protein